MIGLGLGNRKSNGIIVGHRLHDTIKVIRVQTNIQFRRRVIVLILLKLGSIESHMSENGASIVHRDHANTVLVEDQRHLHEHGLQSLSKSTDRGSLHCLSHNKVVHLYLPSATLENDSTHYFDFTKNG